MPYLYSEGEVVTEHTEIDTLVFFGKRSRMKGFPQFVSALKILLGDARFNEAIKKVVLIGGKDSNLPEENAFIDQLREHLNVQEWSGPREQTLQTLRRLAPQSLFALPYIGDNHPLSILELVDLECQFMAFAAGGIPEMIPSYLHQQLLCESNPEALAAEIKRLIDWDGKARSRLTRELRTACVSEQLQINQGVIARVQPPKVNLPSPVRLKSEMVTVIVPVFNTDLAYLDDLIFGLNNQSLPPAEVVFVDDGSGPEYSARLTQWLAGKVKLPYQLACHELNRGLAATRNTALSLVKTKYVINIDSDDVPLTDFVHDIVNLLERNPSYWVAGPALEGFQNGEDDWKKAVPNRYQYAGFAEGCISSQINNYLGHANSGFRTDMLRRVGGWDDSDKSMWEDWALYLKISSVGGKIGIIPRTGCLYRVRTESMLRTYSKFPAEQRLARGLVTLPMYDAVRLRGMMRELEESQQELLRVNLMLQKTAYRFTARVLNRLNRLSRFKFFLWKIFTFVEKALRKVKKIVRSITSIPSPANLRSEER